VFDLKEVCNSFRMEAGMMKFSCVNSVALLAVMSWTCMSFAQTSSGNGTSTVMTPEAAPIAVEVFDLNKISAQDKAAFQEIAGQYYVTARFNCYDNDHPEQTRGTCDVTMSGNSCQEAQRAVAQRAGSSDPCVSCNPRVTDNTRHRVGGAVCVQGGACQGQPCS
jgi:hypothetical protein